ncbi:MAG: TonB-dependent receptor [Chitinophagaceae bacterium]
MLRIYFALILLSAALVANSQHTITISGTVVDDKTNAVADASVYILNTNSGTFTDKQGRFELKNIPEGKYIIQVSAVGFAVINEEIDKNNTNIAVTLSQSSIHLDEVIVSAQKREELLQRLPFSVSALSAKKVEQYRLWNTRDITAIIPNLYAGNPGDNRNVTSIRGITSSSYDPAVATYIDGVNQFSLDTYIAQLFDVERIEVLRGPQGTLYGRNAMGGVINIITKKPTNHTSGFAEVNLGNYGQQRHSIGLRTPVVSDKLFFGAVLMYDKMDGYYTNEFNNTSFDKQHTLTGNYYVAYKASEKLAFTVNVKHNNHRNNGPFSLVNGVADAFANPFKLSQDATSKMIDNTFNSSLSVNYTGRSLNFTSQTAWQTNQRYYTRPLDGDFSPIDGVTIINNYGHKWNNVKALTQEFRFSSPASVSSSLKWTTGIYLFHQSVPNKQATHFGKDAAFVGAPDINFSTISTTKGNNSGAAFYGQISYSITKDLELTAGLRYDYEHKKQNVLGEYQKDPDPNPQFETRPDTTASTNFNAFSPKLSLAYQFSKASNGYVSYSRGFRAGGFTQLSSDPSQPPLFSFKPEYSNNYEIGLKNNLLNNRLRLNIALFYANITNAQVPTLILPDAVTITKNAGKLNTKGIELELSAKPVKNLEIEYNLGYTDAKYKTLKLSVYGSEQDFKDNKQVFTPVTTSSLAAQYSFDLGTSQLLKFVVRGEWMALGKHYFDLANTIQQSAYSLLNTRAGITSKNYDIILWVRNLTDQKYISYAYDFGAVHLGAPQTYGITLTGRF